MPSVDYAWQFFPYVSHTLWLLYYSLPSFTFFVFSVLSVFLFWFLSCLLETYKLLHLSKSVPVLNVFFCHLSLCFSKPFWFCLSSFEESEDYLYHHASVHPQQVLTELLFSISSLQKFLNINVLDISLVFTSYIFGSRILLRISLSLWCLPTHFPHPWSQRFCCIWHATFKRLGSWYLRYCCKRNVYSQQL